MTCRKNSMEREKAWLVVTLPFQYLSKLVGTWKSPSTFNQIPHEEAIYSTWTYLDLYEMCYLYNIYSVRIMFSLCKDIYRIVIINIWKQV